METDLTPVRTALRNYSGNQCTLFVENFISCRTSLGRKNIHNLRLSVKNLTAIAVLTKELSKNRRSSGQLPPDLGRLFALLGKYRDLQLCQEALKVHSKELRTSFRKYEKYLKSRMASYEARLGQLIMKTKPGISLGHIRVSLARILDGYPDETILKDKIESFIRNTWLIIEKMLNERHTSANLHAIRIRLKQLYYILIVYKEVERGSRILPARADQLDDFQELLGRWHDSIIFLKVTREFYKRKSTGRKNRMKTYFLIGNIRKKQGRLNRRIKKICPQLIAGVDLSTAEPTQTSFSTMSASRFE